MKNNTLNMSRWLVILALATSGCEQPVEDTVSTGSNMVNIEGSLQGGGGQQKVGKLQALDLSQYYLYCVTFTQPVYVAAGAISPSGYFSVQMPLNTAFGCFINDLNNVPVASVVVREASTDYTAETTSAVSLQSSVNLGSLTLDLESGLVEVPRDRVASAQSQTASSLNIESIHDKAWTMSCVNTSNSTMDQQCADFLNDGGPTVYTRIMLANENGQRLYGFGVWRSEQDFNNCGGIDLTNAEVNSLANEGVTFDQGGIAAGTAFVNDQNLCLTRDGQAPQSYEDPRYYYAAGPLHDAGDAYTLHTEDNFQVANGCQQHHWSTVTFRSGGGSEMLGNFTGAEYYVESIPGACGQAQSNNESFVVRFTPQ